MERRQIEQSIDGLPDQWSIETIGFGVIAAAIRTTELIQKRHPERIIVIGIAGLFPVDDPQHQVGTATWFDEVTIDGIGIGQGDDYQSAFELGWQWLDGDSRDGTTLRVMPGPDAHSDSQAAPRQLLTVCAASANPAEAALRKSRFPNSLGEDMESFSVALAANRAGIPIQILRGFSNPVGRRDKQEWQIENALTSVATQLRQVT
ncbi:futalosine hydrolase [Rhodopirellula sp. MGV]|nr:futalosine hydrolase [Rhodopirellula sp. MGV]PNY37026.1 futalosine hydrolase [Rhodopirellula baltica]